MRLGHQNWIAPGMPEPCAFLGSMRLAVASEPHVILMISGLFGEDEGWACYLVDKSPYDMVWPLQQRLWCVEIKNTIYIYMSYTFIYYLMRISGRHTRWTSCVPHNSAYILWSSDCWSKSCSDMKRSSNLGVGSMSWCNQNESRRATVAHACSC